MLVVFNDGEVILVLKVVVLDRFQNSKESTYDMPVYVLNNKKELRIDNIRKAMELNAD